MSWNIDEEHCPGPYADDGKILRLFEDSDYAIRVSGSFRECSVTGVSVPSDIEINDLVTLVDYKYDTVFEGYLNGWEVETSFKGGHHVTSLKLTNKLIDVMGAHINV